MMRIYVEGGLFMAKMMYLGKKTPIFLGFSLAVLALLLSNSLDVAGSHLSADTPADYQTPAAKKPASLLGSSLGPTREEPPPTPIPILESPTSLEGGEGNPNHLYLKGAERALRVPTEVSVSVTGWTDIMTEDFEGAFPRGDWELSGSDGTDRGEYYWAKRDCRPHAGSHSAWAVGGGTDDGTLPCVADYPNHAFSYMIYGPFDLAKATDAELIFHYWRDSQSNDSLGWFASIDGNNFYGSSSGAASGSWREQTFDLTNVSFLGDVTRSPSVWIAFVFESDESGTRAEGVYVDDIVLSAYMVARPPTTLTVCPDGSCDYTSIQDAIDEAIYGDIISVAPGTYKESIAMVNGVRIKGSGAGESIIDGDGAYRVVEAYGASITGQAVLEGFTVTGGVAPPPFNAGGGILVETGASPIIVGNEIISNTALDGAGIGVMFGASPDIQDNVISGNSTAGGSGGGIYVFNSWPTITSNTISANAGYTGGGIHSRVESYPTIVNNTIVSNTASESGGGIWIGGWHDYATGGILTGNTIRANTTHYYGGGIQIETNASVNLSNNSILSNTVDWHGGGVCVTGDSSLTSSEDTIVRNVAVSYNGGGVVLNDHSSASINMATITDNRASDGGGISTHFWGRDCDLRLTNSTLARNIATGEGGGIYVGRDSSATLQTTNVISNSGGKGGGIYLDGNASLIGNTITDNTASGRSYDSHGGGIYAGTNASFTVNCNNILSNTADHNGGGIYMNRVRSPTLRGNIIQSNEAKDEYGGGGGVYINRSGQFAFSGNLITQNRAAHAGGIYFDNSAGTLHNNLIARNASPAQGGGLYILSNVSCTPSCPTAPIVSNNTIVANPGSGIYIYIYSSGFDAPTITNNIIVSHTYGVYGGGTGTLLSYNNVWSNSVAPYYGVTPGSGSISADPLFVSGPRGEYYLSQVAAGQVVTSPCVDAGSDTAANLGLDNRTTRTDEIRDSGTVDMGYHYSITRSYDIFLPLMLRDF
jgi:parallel beta-helix repeat protein